MNGKKNHIEQKYTLAKIHRYDKTLITE